MSKAVDACRRHIVYSHYGAWNFSEGAAGDVVQIRRRPSVGKSITGRFSRRCTGSGTTAIWRRNTACPC